MINLENVKHHPTVEEIVDVLCNRTQNTDRKFFRVETVYFLAKMASNMRAKMMTKDRGEIPVNMYALALAVSGAGKGFSVSLLENDFLGGFQQRFMEDTFLTLSQKTLYDIALKRSLRNGTQDTEEYEKVEKEFKQCGPLMFAFDSGTPAAVKQIRQKLLMGGSGAISLQIDEIGSNLVGSIDLLNVFLELYDQGMIKPKAVKNTAENLRSEEIIGKTPSNMLMFGTPSKLLDGGMVEDQFYSMLDIGYARRCIFAYGHRMRAAKDLSAEEIYRSLIDKSNQATIQKWHDHFIELADPARFNWTMEVTDPVAIRLLEYKIECEKFADTLPEHEEIKKTEISHRYFKALKLAGTYAFIDESIEVTMDHLMSAILLVEESGEAFQAVLNREKTYVKLAKYLASVTTEQTHADLHEALPFYKSASSARNEMLTFATAWGYNNHIIIKKTFSEGIEFFKGEALEETNLDEVLMSYSNTFAEGYRKDRAPFSKLDLLFKAKDMHWTNHAFVNNYRNAENAIPGFNLVVLDVDGGTPLWTVHDLLAEYTFATYTTKRHDPENEHRFRLVLPINYMLKLDGDAYKEFYAGLLSWLPFKVDESANQRERKWLTNPNAEVKFNEGKLLDALPFIPKTQKNEQYKANFQNIENMDNLERWFAGRIAEGNRNNNLLKYAMALVDSGYRYEDIEAKVLHFNQQLANGLTEDELRNTILTTVAKKTA